MDKRVEKIKDNLNRRCVAWKQSERKIKEEQQALNELIDTAIEMVGVGRNSGAWKKVVIEMCVDGEKSKIKFSHSKGKLIRGSHRAPISIPDPKRAIEIFHPSHALRILHYALDNTTNVTVE